MTNHTVEPRPEAVGAFEPLPGAVEPGAALAVLARLRREAEAEIERLLAFLDSTEPDPDLEPAGDELDASYPEGGQRAVRWHEDDEVTWRETGSAMQTMLAPTAPDGTDDDEEDDHAEEDDPAGGDINDEPHDDNELDDDLSDREPWLGWPNEGSQGTGRWGGYEDREAAVEPSRKTIEAARARHKADPHRDPVHEVRRELATRRPGRLSIHGNVRELVLDGNNRPLGYRPLYR